MSTILDLLVGPLGALGAAVLAALAWLLDRRRQRSKGKSEGRTEAKGEALKDASERVEKGRKAVHRNRGRKPSDRVQSNDNKW